MTKSVSIAGFGWLGHQLAIHFRDAGVKTLVSLTSDALFPQVTASGLAPFLLDTRRKVYPEDGFFASDVLIIAIPAGQAGYLEWIEQITMLSGGQRLVLLSSTSVYPRENGVFDEESNTVINDQVLAERIVLSEAKHNVIVRLGGLIGPGRHPGRFLAGRNNITGGQDPVNLLPHSDAVGIISAVSQQSVEGVFNAVSPDHPLKQEFYEEASRSLSLPVPIFLKENPLKRIIDGAKVCQLLSYRYKEPDLRKYLQKITE